MKRFTTTLACLILFGATGWAQIDVRHSSPKTPPPTRVFDQGWDKRDAAHLLRRAGFGGSQAEIAEIYNIGRSAAIDFLVNYEEVDNAPMWTTMQPYNNTNEPGRGLDVAPLQYGNPVVINFTTGATANATGNYYLGNIERYWMFRMANTRHPLEEKLTLFWHDHFATGASKVNDWQYMLWQNQTLRRNALGNFKTFVTEMTKDPAMLVWLDNRLNIKGRAQENFARELMELFTVGIGNYTENDIKELARIFTGWGLSRERKFQFFPNNHDTGSKVFMGLTIDGKSGDAGIEEGNFIIDHLVTHAATARYISKKLFEFLAYTNPSDSVIERLADVFTDSNYEIKPLVRAILESPEFWSEQSRRTQVKSPVEYTVMAIKQLEASVNWTQGRGNLENPSNATQQMGMRLFEPPDVAGWDWGTAWFNTATTLVRFNFANSLATYRNMTGPNAGRVRVDPAVLIQGKNLVSPEDVADYFLDLLVQQQVSPDTRYTLVEYLQTDDAGKFVPFKISDATMVDKKVRGLIYLILIHPEYQMK